MHLIGRLDYERELLLYGSTFITIIFCVTVLTSCRVLPGKPVQRLPLQVSLSLYTHAVTIVERLNSIPIYY
jgi:hypothetical protein